jgi:hypothetical protein
MVADVSIVGCSDSTPIWRLHVSVMQSFVELAECNPEAIEFMRGRMFVRAQH